MKTAINNLAIEVEFSFLPFQLNPNMGEDGELIANYFSRQFGWNEGKLRKYQQSLVVTAAEAGVSIDFSKRTHYYNTHNAHLLMHWAERFNKQTVLNERLIKAYFNDGLDISKLSVLLDIAQDIGLDRQQTNTAMTSVLPKKEPNKEPKQVPNQALGQELGTKVQRYKKFNLTSVPAFIINNSVLICGSNSVEYFEQALAKINETT